MNTFVNIPLSNWERYYQVFDFTVELLRKGEAILIGSIVLCFLYKILSCETQVIYTISFIFHLIYFQFILKERKSFYHEALQVIRFITLDIEPVQTLMI